MEVTQSDKQKTQIRCLITSIYDMQKLRISAGNRLVQSFYVQMGVHPSTSPDDLEKDNKKVIDTIKSEYSRVSDGIAEGLTLGKVLKKYTDKGAGDEELKFIRSKMDYKLVEGYMYLLKSEEESIKVLKNYVEQHPLYNEFFKDVKGCGTLMSAVCIAYLDPKKARHVSSFYRYCGLDTVQDEDKDGNKLYLVKEDGKVKPIKVRRKLMFVDIYDERYIGEVKKSPDFDDNGEPMFVGENGEILHMEYATRVVTDSDGRREVPVYEVIDTGEEYIGDVVVSEHGRRKGDTEMFEYTDKDGNVKLKRGITYNPFVKTKLMGVLTGCLLKAKDPVYSTMYYDYRKRLDNSSVHKDYTDSRKNMMAQRYMIKQFLRNLWVAWRTIEGLPVDNPYEVEKLGNLPHKYNAYQVDNASGQSKSYKDFRDDLVGAED